MLQRAVLFLERGKRKRIATRNDRKRKAREKESARFWRVTPRKIYITLRLPIRKKKREIDPRVLILREGTRCNIIFPSVYFTLLENRRILQSRFLARDEFLIARLDCLPRITFGNKFLARPRDEKRSLLLLERGTKQQKRASLELTSQQQVAPFKTFSARSRTTRTRFSRNKHKLVNNEDARTLTRKYLPLSGIHLHFMRVSRDEAPPPPPPPSPSPRHLQLVKIIIGRPGTRLRSR